MRSSLRQIAANRAGFLPGGFGVAWRKAGRILASSALSGAFATKQDGIWRADAIFGILPALRPGIRVTRATASVSACLERAFRRYEEKAV